MPSGDSWPVRQQTTSKSLGCNSAPKIRQDYMKQVPLVLTPLHIDAAGLVLVDERLHLLRPGWWEQQGIESRVSLLLIDEFGQVLLGHVGFGFSMTIGQREELRCVSFALEAWTTLFSCTTLLPPKGWVEESLPFTPNPRNSLRSEDLIDFWPRTEAHEEALVHRFWEVLGIDSIILEEPSPCYPSSHLLR